MQHPTDQQLSRIQSIFALNALHGYLHVGEKFYTIQVEGTVVQHLQENPPRIEVSDYPRKTFEGSDLDKLIDDFRQWSVSRFVSAV